jgi:tRNA(Ile)-lysidine synthetase-like protein
MSEASRDIIEYCEHDTGDGEICRLDLNLMGGSLWGGQVLDRMLAERSWPLGSREEALMLRRATVGAHTSYKGDHLRRERDHLILCRTQEEVKKINLFSEVLEDLSGLEIPNDPGVLWVGESSLKSPHSWRNWEYGDRISPTGMDGTVNVSDLLTQWKVPNGARPSAHVLLDSEGDVLWVYIKFESTVLSRVSRKVKVSLGEPIIAFKAEA